MNESQKPHTQKPRMGHPQKESKGKIKSLSHPPIIFSSPTRYHEVLNSRMLSCQGLAHPPRKR